MFPRLKKKLKDRHFDTTEIIKAESQALLNLLIEHDFRDAFKKMAERLGTVHKSGRGLLPG
jgi:predicted helicase